MFDVDNTVLLVIDVQGKLAESVYEHDKVISNIQRAIKGFKIFGVPILWTEQVPEKIGATIPAIAGLMGDQQPIEKLSFSCFANARFMEELKELNRTQILITGIETHVCVYQTASDLVANNYEVEVAVDCVSSRTKDNKEIALERIKEVGAGLTSLEIIATELLGGADHEHFREIIKLIK